MVLGQELFRRVYAEDSPEEVHSWLLTQVQRLGSGEDDARLLWPDSFELYEEIMRKRKERAALPASERRTLTWPWSTWNAYIDPLDPGVLCVLSAGDGHGKTLYAENLAEHWARGGLNVVFVHFELNRALMLDRRTVRATGISRRALKTGELTPEQELARQRANETLRAWPGSITYVHTPRWTMERAMGEVSALVGEDLCDVFIVDYLEKAAPSNRQLKSIGNNVWAREADDVEIVKGTAEALERPAVLLAQLNKSGKQQTFEALDRTSIRGAGEKTEKANVVILLYKETSDSKIVQVRIDKNTMGPCGTFEQYMEGSRFLVTDIQKGPTR
jgi:replicative DNA helicase